MTSPRRCACDARIASRSGFSRVSTSVASFCSARASRNTDRGLAGMQRRYPPSTDTMPAEIGGHSPANAAECCRRPPADRLRSLIGEVYQAEDLPTGGAEIDVMAAGVPELADS